MSLPDFGIILNTTLASILEVERVPASQSWTEQLPNADPALPPQSWLVDSRKGTLSGRAPKGAGILKGGREW